MVLRFKYPDAWTCDCGREHRIPIRQIIIEERALPAVAETVDRLDLGRKCLIVEDSVTREIAGTKVRQLLEADKYSADEAVIDRADMHNVRRVCERLRSFDFCIAVGGGSPIDVAKMATHETRVPFISVPTALSHDGIGSPISSIIQNHHKTSIPADPPICIIADLEILSSAPQRMISAGYGDVLAKITSLKDWELGKDEKGEYYCEKAAQLAFMAVNDIMESYRSTDKSQRIRRLAEALLNCSVSMIMVGSSRPASGSEHLFSHFLDRHAERPAMHGEQCAIGTVLMAKYHSEHNANWWKEPDFQWSNIKRMERSLDAALSLKEIGLDRDLAARAIVEASQLRPDRWTILHQRPPSIAEARALIESTSVR